MLKMLTLTIKDLPGSTLPLFAVGLLSVLFCHSQFVMLIDGNNPKFLFGLMVFGPGCLFAVSFLTTFTPALCRSHLQAYVAFISGVEIGIAIYLGFSATQWYVTPDVAHLEPTVVSLTLILGCLQWSKSKWEKRIRALLEEQRQGN